MRKYFIAFLVTTLFNFQVPLQISGKYKVVHNQITSPEGETDYIIEFREEYYTKQFQEIILEGQKGNYTEKLGKIITKKGKIIRISNRKSKNLIRLRDIIPKTETDPNGIVIVEFEDSNLDTIPFRTANTKNLNKTLHTGKLIKIK